MRFFIAFLIYFFMSQNIEIGAILLLIGWKISDQIEELKNSQNLWRK